MWFIPASVIVCWFSLSVVESTSRYSLTEEQCKATVRTIGQALKTRGPLETVVKGTFLSPRCELRRIQDTDRGEKTAFLLRMLTISNRRRWTGNYFFYSDPDCLQPSYGLEMQGQLSVKNQKISFNFSSINIAIYQKAVDTELQAKYNKSCPGVMIGSGSPKVYSVRAQAKAQRECLRGIGVDRLEFEEAFFQTHDKKITELIQKSVDLRKKSSTWTHQWPLVSSSTQYCLTCRKVGLARLKHPPKLYTRNSSGIDGMWGSFRCERTGRSVYTTRFDKFERGRYESFLYWMEHTGPEKCQEPIAEIRTTGTIRKVDDSVEVPGGVVYEMSVKHAFLTLRKSQMVSVLNRNKRLCGGKTWEIDKAQDLVPTKGCSSIGFSVGPPELVLIRTVRDENRNEMYFGANSIGRSGPVKYHYLTESCDRYPIAVTTPAPTTPTTVELETFPTTEGYVVEEKLSIEPSLRPLNMQKKPTNDAMTMHGGLKTVVTFCLIFIHARHCL